MSDASCLETFLHAVKDEKPALLEAQGESSFDADEFSTFVRKHAVAVYLHSVLEESRLLSALPARLRTSLSTARDEQTTRADRLLPEIHRLRELLAGEGLDVIYMKGPFLSKRFYGDPGRRSYGDIDLLVRDRGALVRCDATLREADYVRRSIPLLGHRAAMRFVYHYEYRCDRAKIDLHWTLRSHFSYKIDYERVWTTSESEQLDGHSFRVLSPEYVMVLLSLSILGDYQKARVRLKFLLDLYMVLRMVGDEADWDGFFDQRKREDLLTISATVLDLMLSILDCRQEYPRLASALAGQRAVAETRPVSEPARLLEWSGKVGDKVRNHIWTFRLHEGGVMRSAAWRLLTEPFNQAVFR
jgi:hypothetical protein